MRAVLACSPLAALAVWASAGPLGYAVGLLA